MEFCYGAPMTKLLKILTFFITAGLFLTGGFAGAKEKTIVKTMTPRQVKFLKEVDRKYQKEHGIYIQLNKRVKITALGSEKKSSGEAWLQKGKMRLIIEKPSPSKIIADGKFIWVESPPPADFKGAKTQVLKTKLRSQKAKQQGLIQLLTGGGLLKFFKVSGVKKQGSNIAYFLQPNDASIDFKRAQVVVNPSSRVIEELHYWDHMDNETSYNFHSTKFNRTLGPSLFRYTPPKDAEVMSY